MSSIARTVTFYLVGCFFSLAACHEELASGTFSGQPRIAVNMAVQSLDLPATSSLSPDRGQQLYAFVSWVRYAGSPDRRFGQPTPVTETSFPSSSTVFIFDAPGEDSLNRFQDSSVPFGVGEIAIFLDENGNGRLDRDDEDNELEPIVGIAVSHALIFQEAEGRALSRSVVGEKPLVQNKGKLRDGFQLVRPRCPPEGEVFSNFEIVNNDEEVRVMGIAAGDAYVEKEGLCWNFR